MPLSRASQPVSEGASERVSARLYRIDDCIYVAGWRERESACIYVCAQYRHTYRYTLYASHIHLEIRTDASVLSASLHSIYVGDGGSTASSYVYRRLPNSINSFSFRTADVKHVGEREGVEGGGGGARR